MTPNSSVPSDSTGRSILLAIGSGLRIAVPAGVDLLPVERPVQEGPALSLTEQQNIVQTALAPLKELARGHRRVVILAGDLSLPAPYEIALPLIEGELIGAGIRATRIVMLACPGHAGPILGRAAVHRYGEHFVGDHECRAWAGSGVDNKEPDPLYAAADLRIGLAPAFAGGGLEALSPNPHNEHKLKLDFGIELGLGQKALIDIVSAHARIPGVSRDEPQAGSANVVLTSGGGAEWEATLEEALLPLYQTLKEAPSSSPDQTFVLALTGNEGLGSARFTLDLWALLQQAEEILASGGSLSSPEDGTVAPPFFEPAGVLAAALGRFNHLILFSAGLAEHHEGDDLTEHLANCPHLSGRVHFCASATVLWSLLNRFHGGNYKLAIQPLGWR